MKLLSLVLLFLLLLPLACSAAASRSPRTGLYFYLDHVPRTITSGEPFAAEISVVNNDNLTRQIEVYGFVYRSSKTYSKSRTENLVILTLSPYESTSITLANNLSAKPGAYRFKAIVKYDINKTKELSTPINITSLEPEERSLEIASLFLSSPSPPVATALLNNTYPIGFDIRLLLESESALSERELFIGPEEELSVDFSLSAEEPLNYLFLKLYHNNTLIDVAELIIKNKGSAAKKEKPFNLVEGDILLNESQLLYSSSSEKSKNIVIYLVLAASLLLNIYTISKKKSSV